MPRVASEFGSRDVQRLLGMRRALLRTLVSEGLVRPHRAARGAYRFSFADLVVLRAAQGLAGAALPRGRVKRALRALRARLPDAPRAALRIMLDGEHVVVREGPARWEAGSGQYLLDFDVEHAPGAVRFRDRRSAEDAERWYAQGEALEPQALDRARAAYERCLRCDPAHLAAWINLGRLLHECGAHARAERIYRRALRHCGADPTLLYNLGVLLEDRGREDEAQERYRQALCSDPGLASAHYNLARLLEARGRRALALRHLRAYRGLLDHHRQGA